MTPTALLAEHPVSWAFLVALGCAVAAVVVAAIHDWRRK